MLHRGRGPSRERGTAVIGKRGQAFVVEPVGIIQDEHRVHLFCIQGREQPVIGGEIVVAFRSLGAVPAQIHADPLESGRGEHLHFPRPRIGEVNVDSHRLGNGGILRNCGGAGQQRTGKEDQRDA